jgi:RNA polymerase sigma-70 factor, ECF subfamily
VANAIDNPAEFTLLYDRYANRIFRFALEQTRSAETADDITSETMLKAFESLHRYDSTRGSFAGWVFAIARNQIRNHFRAHKRMWREVSRIWERDTTDDALSTVAALENAEQVHAALDRVSASDREILLLRYAAGLSSQEISEAMNISDEAARTRLSRARKRIASSARRSFAARSISSG